MFAAHDEYETDERSGPAPADPESGILDGGAPRGGQVTGRGTGVVHFGPVLDVVFEMGYGFFD